jgi:hypothetical protein
MQTKIRPFVVILHEAIRPLDLTGFRNYPRTMDGIIEKLGRFFEGRTEIPFALRPCFSASPAR